MRERASVTARWTSNVTAAARASAWVGVFIVWGVEAAPARADDIADGRALLAAREDALTRQRDAAVNLARQQAWLGYRLTRARDLTFFGAPGARDASAASVDAAFFAYRRGRDEAVILDRERARVRADKDALAAADDDHEPTSPTPALTWPIRGPIVPLGAPGLRKDSVTGVEDRVPGLALVTRYDQPVRAPGDGTVRRIELLPQGGRAIVIEHGDGWTSVIAGLRGVSAAVGDRVGAEDVVGHVGRTLDGAPVLAWTLFSGRLAYDPRRAIVAVRTLATTKRAPRSR